MRFWDSSAIVPLVMPETRSAALVDLVRADPVMVLWWATPIECQSAVFRRHRDGHVGRDQVGAFLERMRWTIHAAVEVIPTEEVRAKAARLLGVHALRAADALQLAAALVWCEEQPAGETFVSLDDRIREAARREGFTLMPDR